MRRVTTGCALLTTMVIVAGADEARADGYVTPWVAVNAIDQNDEGHRGFGVTTGYMGAGVFGFEADVGYASNVPRPFLFDDGYAITAPAFVPSCPAASGCCERTWTRGRWGTSHARPTSSRGTPVPG